MLKIATHVSEGQQGLLKKVAPTIVQQVERLARHLGIDYELHLSPVEPRKGGANQQGLRAQRYEPDEVRPAILLLAQPGSNDTCFLWRLQLPRGTDCMLVYARMSAAIEEGWHLVEGGAREPANQHNVVPIRPDVLPPEVAQPSSALAPQAFNPLTLLTDNLLLVSLLSYVYSRVQQGGHGRTIQNGVALQEIVAQLGDGSSTRDAEKIVAVFEEREWIKQNPNGRSFTYTQAGIDVLTKAGLIGDAQVEVHHKVVTETTSVIVNDPGDLEQRVRSLGEKARKYAEALSQIPLHENAVGGIKQEMDQIHDRLSVLRAELEHKAGRLNELQRIAQSPEYAGAAAEFERIKKLFGV